MVMVVGGDVWGEVCRRRRRQVARIRDPPWPTPPVSCPGGAYRCFTTTPPAPLTSFVAHTWFMVHPPTQNCRLPNHHMFHPATPQPDVRLFVKAPLPDHTQSVASSTSSTIYDVSRCPHPPNLSFTPASPPHLLTVRYRTQYIKACTS